MATTEQLRVTLPTEVIEAVRAKVRSGEYANESDVIREAVSALLARDCAIDDWVWGQVGPAYDALKADPSRGVTADDVRARLAAEHAKRR